MKKAIIFDLDGTLVDSCGICITILEGMLQDRGVWRRIDPAIARPLMSRGGEAMVSGLLGEDGLEPALELQEFRSRYKLLRTPHSALFDGVQDGIAQLRRTGFALAICSNKPQQLCELVLRDTGLDAAFDVVVGGAPAFRSKPAPDLLDEVLAQLGLSPEECIFVGDSDLDHDVARDAGIPFHFLTYGYAEQGWRPSEGQTHHCFADLVEELVAYSLAAPVA